MTGWLKPLGFNNGGYIFPPIVLMMVGIAGLPDLRQEACFNLEEAKSEMASISGRDSSSFKASKKPGLYIDI